MPDNLPKLIDFINASISLRRSGDFTLYFKIYVILINKTDHYNFEDIKTIFQSILNNTCEGGHIDIVKHIINNCNFIDVHRTDTIGRTCFNWAYISKDDRIISILKTHPSFNNSSV